MNLEKCIRENRYEEALKIVFEMLKQNEEKVENIIVYAEWLVCKSPNEKQYYCIKSLMDTIMNTYPKLDIYLNQLDIVNRKYVELYKRYNELYDNIRRVDIGAQLTAISHITNIEICNINNALYHGTVPQYKDENDFSFYEKSPGYVDKVLRDFSSLTNNIIKSYNSKNKSKVNYLDIVQNYADDIKQLRGVVGCLNDVDDILDMIREGYTTIYFNLDGFLKQEYSKDYTKRYLLPQLRIQRYEFLKSIKYIKGISDKFVSLQYDDMEKCIIVNEELNSFSLKYDIFSSAFIKNCKIIEEESRRQISEVICENYLEGEIFYNKVVMYNEEMQYTFNDLIDFYIALLGLTNFYYAAEQTYLEKYNRHSVCSVINIEKNLFCTWINSFYTYCLGRRPVLYLNDIIKFYTFGFLNVEDIVCCPIIETDKSYIILPTVVRQNNFARTFIEHINKLNISLKAGELFEKYFKSILVEHEFEVYNPTKSQLNFTTRKGNKGDIDVLALKDNYLFCIQLKNKSNPLEKQEYLNFDRKLKKAVKQLEPIEEYLKEDPKGIKQYFGIKEMSHLKIIKVVISNSFYRSGECIDGIYITDMSAIHVLFDKGHIYLRKTHEEIKLREGEKVTAEELVMFLQNPYFTWPGVYMD